MRFTLLIASLALIPLVQGLHFYLEGSQAKCFVEDLPKETLVVGNYRAEEFNSQLQQYVENPSIGIQITVQEENGAKLVNQKGSSNGRFAFTSAEAGEHNICFKANGTDGWFATSHIRFTLDMIVGENGADPKESKDGKLSDLYWKVRELNSHLLDVKREQEQQREREMAFRDQSEKTNSRVVWWIILQIGLLAGTCYWQTRHLKHFFIAKKLV